MQSLNFEILREHYPRLADFGRFAEGYVYSDPEGAATKLRMFGEALAQAICVRYELPRSFATQFHLLQTVTLAAQEMGKARLIVGVNAQNKTGLSFYETSGFKRLGTRKFTVGATTHDDVVLVRPL